MKKALPTLSPPCQSAARRGAPRSDNQSYIWDLGFAVVSCAALASQEPPYLGPSLQSQDCPGRTKPMVLHATDMRVSLEKYIKLSFFILQKEYMFTLA